MSRLHRSASSQMSRPAISIQSGGGWTFGSPSVLMMFYRAAGRTCRASWPRWMNVCPTTIRITNRPRPGRGDHHGAEAAVHARDASPMRTSRWSAPTHRSRDNGQKNMALCCDFLSRRLSSARRCGAALYLCGQTRSSCCSITMPRGSTSGVPPVPIIMRCGAKLEQIPEIFVAAPARPPSICLRPGKPMMELIENQVLSGPGGLCQGDGTQRRDCWRCARGCTMRWWRCISASRRRRPMRCWARREEARDALLRRRSADAEPDGLGDAVRGELRLACSPCALRAR